MNRRLLWALLALLPVVALLGAARYAVTWRPHKIGAVVQGTAQSDVIYPNVRGTDREVAALFMEARPTLFDLANGKRTVWPGGVTAGGEALWQLSATGQPRLLIRDGAGTRAYALTAQAHKYARATSAENIVVSLNRSKLQMFVPDRFYRWNRATGQLEKSANLGEDDFVGLYHSPGEYAITRDGQAIMSAENDHIERVPTDGGARRKIAVIGIATGASAALSPFGAYAHYEDRSPGTNSKSRAMVDASNGRVLWRFQIENVAEPVFSPDEQWVAISRATPYAWELRETRSGRIVKTFPSVFRGQFGSDGPAQSGGFSPAGDTFYSLSPQGDVYRQRIR